MFIISFQILKQKSINLLRYAIIAISKFVELYTPHCKSFYFVHDKHEFRCVLVPENISHSLRLLASWCGASKMQGVFLYAPTSRRFWLINCEGWLRSYSCTTLRKTGRYLSTFMSYKLILFKADNEYFVIKNIYRTHKLYFCTGFRLWHSCYWLLNQCFFLELKWLIN